MLRMLVLRRSLKGSDKLSEYVKSPLNYVGGKYKILPQIIPLFPKDMTSFLDLFGGGANVSVNVKANQIIYNDNNTQVVEILKTIKEISTEDALKYIDSLIQEYNLSKENADGFLKLRSDYNKSENKNPLMLYTIICYAFNYQIRFNSKGEYNMPFGKNRSSFSPVLREKFIRFSEELHNKLILFYNSDFRGYDSMKASRKGFIYCDPLYLNSTATYNEQDGWTEKDENDLRTMLKSWSVQGLKWGLSNNIAINTTLADWANENRYNIHYINNSYGNSNYHKKDKSDKDIKVLITNY